MVRLNADRLREVNSVTWQTVPYTDNTLGKKCGPGSTAAVAFQYFIWVSTCNTGESEFKKIRRAKANMTKYNFITPD